MLKIPLAALVAVSLAVPAVAGQVSRKPNQTLSPAQTIRAQDLTAAPEARDAYAEFWKSMPPDKASSLERRLEVLERRAAAGENVDAEVRALRQAEPQLSRMDTQIWHKWVHVQSMSGSPTSRQDLKATGGTAAGAECSGIGWIGRNGQVRCIGKLVVK